ncbi:MULTISPECIES: hypothetical protein [Streptomyces]|uniref:hypothetical protein n=1 Tax=Streptomyces TaxID=1883 RepID=UPI0027B8F965|nr:hypothetical protein [Streptomyces sp. OK228]
MQLPRDPSNVTHVLVAAFPARLAGAVQSVLAVMPDAMLAPAEPFEVVEVQGETVAIPYRIHNEEPETGGSERPLTETQQVIFHCLYPRHGDGRVRQRHLEKIMASSEPWVVPSGRIRGQR